VLVRGRELELQAEVLADDLQHRARRARALGGCSGAVHGDLVLDVLHHALDAVELSPRRAHLGGGGEASQLH